MKSIKLLVLLLLSYTCIGQVYRYESKDTRSSKVWTSKPSIGFVSISDREIAITENGYLKGFTVVSVAPFGNEYIVYSCLDENNQKLKIITVGYTKDKDKFKLLVSYPSKYYRYNLTRL
jgi:hypothetical protein